MLLSKNMQLLTMEKEPRKLIFRVTPWIFLLVLPLLYVHVLWGSNIQQQRFHYGSSPGSAFSGRKVIINNFVEEKHEYSLDFLLSRLVKEEDDEKFKATGFACNAEAYSKHCVTNKPVAIDTKTMTVTVSSDNQPIQEKVIVRPYARQDDDILLRKVTPVTIQLDQAGNNSQLLRVCEYTHDVPAAIFSSSGFVGNTFHEINEIILPLFITTSHFKSLVLLIVEDHNPSFLNKYSRVLSGLTKYEIMNPASNQSVHCFPGAVIGLKFHGHLSVNSSDIPVGLSVRHFRQFLRESLNLKHSHVSQIKRPTVMLIARRSTRRFLNEDEMIPMMEELGFRVIVAARAKIMSNFNLFANMINSCSVLVGVHGAGLTNELFLPDGAVMVQVDIIGLEWAATAYFGNPTPAMGIHYLRYKIEPEESSLLKVFGGQRNHTYITDPAVLPAQAGKEVYLNGQNVRINVTRFRETMVQALSLVHDSPL